MNIVSYRKIFEHAKTKHITVGAFNTINMETVQGVARAAQALGVPVIIQCYHHHLLHSGPEWIVAMVQEAAKSVDVPIALGLDHGQSFEQAAACIQAGFSGVMLDFSNHDIEINIKETRKLVDYAHKRDVSVEAELGTILDGSASIDEIASGQTNPKLARDFVNKTGVDCLAVSIGTAHGPYKHTPVVNFSLLEELINETPCPIVVHGGSGTPKADLLRMVQLGVTKINIGTDLMQSYMASLHSQLMYNVDSVDIVDLMGKARDAVTETTKRYMEIFSAYKLA